MKILRGSELIQAFSGHMGILTHVSDSKCCAPTFCVLLTTASGKLLYVSSFQPRFASQLFCGSSSKCGPQTSNGITWELVRSSASRRVQNRWRWGPALHPQVTVKAANSSSTTWSLFILLWRVIQFWLRISYFSMQKSWDVEKCKDDNRNQTFSALTVWGKSFAR